MKSTSFYIVVGARYYTKDHSGAVHSIRAERLTQRSPALEAGEVAVRMKLTLDETVFKALLDAGELEVDIDHLVNPTVEQLESANDGT